MTPVFIINKLKEIADSIWVSKLRYGLQLYSEVRTTNEQPTPQIMKELQKSQNKLLRVLTGKKVSDRIKIEDMLKTMPRVFSDRQKCDPQFVRLSDLQFVRPMENASFVRPIHKMRHLSDLPFVQPIHKMRHLSDLYKMRHLSDPTFVRPDVCPT